MNELMAAASRDPGDFFSALREEYDPRQSSCNHIITNMTTDRESSINLPPLELFAGPEESEPKGHC